MLQEPPPGRIARCLESHGPAGSVLLLSTKSDVDDQGGNASVWLLATEKELLVIADGDTPRLLRSFNIATISDFRNVAVVGCGRLEARIDGVWVTLIRYSNRLAMQFRTACNKLSQLHHVQEFVVDADDHEEDRRCPKCGVTLRFAGDACPRCVPHKQIFNRLWQLLKPYRGKAAVMGGLSILAVAVELVPPLLQKVLVDRVLQIHSPDVDLHQFVMLLLFIVLGLAAVRLVAAVIAIWNGSVSSYVGTALTSDLRQQMVRKLQALSVSYHDRNQVGMLMSRVSYDTEAMHTLMHHVTGGFVLQVLQLIGIAIMLFWLNPKLAFFTMLPMPFVVFGSLFFSRYLHPRHHRYWDAVGKQAAALTGMLSGIRVVKAFTQEGREYDRFQQSSDRLREARRTVDVSTATFSSLMGFTFGLGGLIVWFVGGRDVLGEEMTLGSLMAFLAYLAMFYTPLTTLTESTTWLSNFSTASQRIFDLLDTPLQVDEPNEPIPLARAKGHIRFQRVGFAYDDNHPTIRDLSFEVQPGEMIGIVGRSGSGKSTLVNLIARMYDVNSGSVSIDGINVRRITSHDLRRNVGMVLQEPFLFEGTVEANIAYGNPTADPQQIMRAAKAASAHAFVLRMPFAYETILGERGAGLSGGERQRLSIARAMLYDPQILILDEATSSVDTESERAIQEALRHFSKGRTTIAIAHRLSTLKHADRLLVFDQGRLIEQGTHAELLAHSGVYASLVHIQSSVSAATNRLEAVAAPPVPHIKSHREEHVPALALVGATAGGDGAETATLSVGNGSDQSGSNGSLSDGNGHTPNGNGSNGNGSNGNLDDESGEGWKKVSADSDSSHGGLALHDSNGDEAPNHALNNESNHVENDAENYGSADDTTLEDLSGDDLTSGATNDDDSESSRDQYELRWLRPDTTRFEQGPHGSLHAMFDGKSYRGVFALRAFPASHQDRYISIHYWDESDSDQELGMIERLEDWPRETQDLLGQSLQQRYLLRTILSIENIKLEKGFLSWSVRTADGKMQFLMQPGATGVKRYGHNGRMLVDADDNYYLIPNFDNLSPAEQRLWHCHVGE